MTLRDLTQEQIKEAQEHCSSRLREWLRTKSNTGVDAQVEDAWNKAYSLGLGHGLDVQAQSVPKPEGQ